MRTIRPHHLPDHLRDRLPSAVWTVARTSGLAIAGMVLGIVSIVLFFLAWIGSVVGVVGLILSLVGLSKSKQMGGPGRDMAIAGVITRAAGIVIGVVVTIIAIQAANELQTDLAELLEEPGTTRPRREQPRRAEARWIRGMP